MPLLAITVDLPGKLKSRITGPFVITLSTAKRKTDQAARDIYAGGKVNVRHRVIGVGLIGAMPEELCSYKRSNRR